MSLNPSNRKKQLRGDNSAVTRELQRFGWLVLQLTRDHGMMKSEIARALGITDSHLNKLANHRHNGCITITADLVRAVRDAFGIDVGYFFDDYDGEVQAIPSYSIKEQRPIHERLEEFETVVRRLSAKHRSDSAADGVNGSTIPE